VETLSDHGSDPSPARGACNTPQTREKSLHLLESFSIFWDLVYDEEEEEDFA